MQEFEKGKIIELWKRGYGSTRIAKALGLNVNTVKSYCRRNGLVGDRSRICTKEESTGTVKPQCKNCGAFIIQRPGTKKKLFCSDKCRMSWWNAHPEMTDRSFLYNKNIGNSAKEG